ncbi:MAG TPA: hypothetical protein VFN61_07450, partial [Acidimicrobiales bacterium]|nr:hypothetical protein [Acidimicrobiales bacterium]
DASANELLTLIVNPNFAVTGSSVSVQVQPSTGSTTFTVTSVYSSVPQSLAYADLADLGTNAPALAAIVSQALAPPGGYALLPQTSQTTQLSGGGTVPATGVLYSA